MNLYWEMLAATMRPTGSEDTVVEPASLLMPLNSSHQADRTMGDDGLDELWRALARWRGWRARRSLAWGSFLLYREHREIELTRRSFELRKRGEGS